MFNGAVIIDIKTDGLDRKSSIILKIEAIKIKGVTLEKRFSSLVFIGKRLDWYLNYIDKVQKRNIKSTPSVSLALCTRADNGGGRVIIGINLGRVLDFVDAERAKGESLAQSRIDLSTLEMGECLLPKEELLSKLGIENDTLEEIAQGILSLLRN